MTRLYTLLTIMIFTFAAQGQVNAAKDRSQVYRPTTAVKFNIFGVIGGQYQMAIEQAITDQWSAQISAGIISMNYGSWLFNPDYDIHDTGFIVAPDVRYYLQPQDDGIYIALRGRYKSVTTDAFFPSEPEDNNEVKFKRTVSSGGVIAGYQMLLDNRLSLDFFGGFALKSVRIKVLEGDNLYDQELKNTLRFSSLSPVSTRYGFLLGYYF